MFENVQFFVFAFKVCKKCYYDLKKVTTKNHEKMHKNENTQNSHRFLALALLGEFVQV
jgi:hypothetical protein